MVYKGFWENIKGPIVGLAPMDGVTDAAMRFITKKHGNPDVVFTEFVSAEGIRAGAVKLMRDFKYDKIESPVVAQLFGKDPNAFYLATLVVCALGFDGVDINMGCPARKVANRGEGAGLIETPKLAAVARAASSVTGAFTINDISSPELNSSGEENSISTCPPE